MKYFIFRSMKQCSLSKSNEFSEPYTASIFRVEDAKITSFLLESDLLSRLLSSSGDVSDILLLTLVDFLWTIRHYIQEDTTLKILSIHSSRRMRFPHSLDNRLTDGVKVVNLTHRQHFPPQKDSWYSFLLESESTPKP
jgi:hypothetical protein